MRTARPLVTCSRINERPAVGNFAVNFHAAIDRAGMHDQRIGFGPGQAGFVQAEKLRVFVDAGEHGLALALVLDAQQVDDVGVANGLLHVVGHAAAHLLEVLGTSVDGPQSVTFAPSLVSAQMSERATRL